MAKLSCRLFTFLLFSVLCGSFVNAQDKNEGIRIPEEVRNAIITLIQPFSGKKAEDASNSESFHEILSGDLAQISSVCEMSSICPKNLSWHPETAAVAALPFGALFAKKIAKLAKPKVWKLGLAMKIGFLKMLIIKKLLLVKGKLKAIKAKPFILKTPFVIVPMAIIAITDILVSQLFSLDLMLDSYQSTNSFPIEAMSDGILGPFDGFPGELGMMLRTFSGLFNPSLLISNFHQADSAVGSILNPAGLLSSESARLFPSFTNSADNLGMLADIFRSGIMEFGNMVTPNLRRLQSMSSFGDFSALQQAGREILNESMVDFFSIINFNDATRRDFRDFVGYAQESDPVLLEVPLMEELRNIKPKFSEAAMLVLESRGDYNKLEFTVEALDNAIVGFERTIRNVFNV